MNKLILALAAMLIATPAVASDAYDGGTTKGWANSCATFLRYTQDPPPEDWSFEEANDGKQCWWHVLDWLYDTNRFRTESYPGSEAEQAQELALGRCGAYIIVHRNNDTSVYDALSVAFDSVCDTY
jgi:hypothetical protein